MRRIPRWLIVVVAILVVAVALRLLVFRPSPVPVDVARVASGTVEEIITNTRAGTVKARLRAKLSPQIGGRVTALPFAKVPRSRRVPCSSGSTTPSSSPACVSPASR